MKKKVISILSASVVLLILGLSMTVSSCGSGGSDKDSVQSQAPKPLNISVFLDLSDRLICQDEQGKDNPISHLTRDTAIINNLVDMFKDKCVEDKIAENKNHFQVLFYPMPDATNVQSLAQNLNVDMAEIKEPAKKKEALLSMKDDFSKSLSAIYNATIEKSDWIGCDIWGFFCNKNAKVDNLCIRKDYRNVLVILTDGYIYHKDNCINKGTSYSYVTSKLLDSGLIESLMMPRTKKLDNLEVLMLEVNPGDPKRHDKLVDLLEDWFKKMGVKRCVVSETDVPVNTKTQIDNFFKME